MHQRFMGNVEALGEREVLIIAASADLARDGHIVEPTGIGLTHYRQNPIVLWSHQPEEPVGVCTAIGIQNGALAAKVEFAPEGVSAKADEVRGLVKSGIVSGVSIGFDPIEAVPLDPSKGSRGGLHIITSELYEISFCSVPVDTNARVEARSFSSRPGALAMLRSLPATNARAVRHVLASIAQPTERPFYQLSPYEQTQAAGEHARATWAIGQARAVERRARGEGLSRDERQRIAADLKR